MGVVEHTVNTETGFIRYYLDSSWETDEYEEAEMRYFTDKKLAFTSCYIPDSQNWYCMSHDTSGTTT